MNSLYVSSACRLLIGVLWAVSCLSLFGKANPKTTAVQNWRQTVEANWLAEEALEASGILSKEINTRDDAAGAVDGVKNGKWGFHTERADKPWWQVDLGPVQTLNKVTLWNRCDAPTMMRNAELHLSDDGKQWRKVYQHPGKVFYGFTDQKPLEITLTNQSARFVRVQISGGGYLYLDEVEVFSATNPAKNIALGCPADQVSLSRWSQPHSRQSTPDWAKRTREVLAYCTRHLVELQKEGLTLQTEKDELTRLAAQPTGNVGTQEQFLAVRWLQRRLALSNPLLNFDSLLFTKRIPGTFNHMSDQYYGWWSQPGGGLYVLRNFKTDQPTLECITDSFKDQGSFLRPTLSYDGRTVLFAWCKHHPDLAKNKDKLTKANVPEDAFFHLFEMNINGSGVRQITHGKYDDFDGRYLPDGRIVFLSTRRGQSLQAGRETAALTMTKADQPDCYVRCGGGPERPVAVYTLHTMDASGRNICAISPFEMFEWTPEVGHDGSILHSRWDYIDRDNMPYMGLWATSPDGSNPRIIYGNYTKAPHCTFEPKSIPNSHKIVFTASAHHAQTMGSLVLLDPSVGTEGTAPITRLTPEVPFPEIESWPKTYYAGPWPLSERFYLVSWGAEGAAVPGPEGWARWHSVRRPNNGMSLYLFDAIAGRELLHSDPTMTCLEPIPVAPRTRPPVMATPVDWNQPKEGRFMLSDVYHGLKTVKRGDIHALRIVAVPPKTHPTMNYPNLGVTRDDPGKVVLGTVPVAEDGSAYFRVPAGVIVFFQALNAQGVAVQTMRSVTHVQPGQTLGCAGCHEHRNTAPPARMPLASYQPPARIHLAPEGTWPFRFDRLIQPVLDAQCVSCHNPNSKELQAAKFDLTPAKAYDALVGFGKPSLKEQIVAGYRRGYSVEGDGIAGPSALLAKLTGAQPHAGVKLEGESLERLITWMDAYAQKSGAFSEQQEQDLERLKAACADMLIERKPAGLKTASSQ
jgi:hypothetical protein